MAQKFLEKITGGSAPNIRDNLARLTELLVRFVLGFTLSGAALFGAVSPFAAGIVACSGVGLDGFSALLGVSLGYLLFCPISWALKYICVCVLIFATATTFRSTDIRNSVWFMPLTAFAAALLVGVVTYASGGWTGTEFIYISLDAVVAGACAFFYSLALSPWSGQLNFDRGEQTAHTASVLILLATLLISLSNVMVFGVFSAGRALAALVVFFAAYSGGVGMGCASGVAMGLAMDAASSAPPIFGLAYGLSGLVAGIFARRSRFIFAIMFILVNAASSIMAFGTDAVPAMLYEVFIASVLFMAAPPRFMRRLSVLIPEKNRNTGAVRAREYTKNRVELASIAFRELYESVYTSEYDVTHTEDISVVFTRAADAVCRKCRRSAECWQENYQTTADALNNIASVLTNRGAVEKNDIPDYFIDACVRPNEFISAVNTETRALLYRRRLKNHLRGSREIAYNQYSDMSDILSGVASELGAGLGFEPELEKKMHRYLQSQGVIADVGVFRDRSGRLHAEITGELGALRRDETLLDKMSAVLSMRLCTPESGVPAGRLELMEAEPLAAVIGVSRMNKKGERISGDRGVYFKTDEGVLYILLSDGMGSGADAARNSADTCRILERFLRSGVAPETAVRILNGIMLLRNEDANDCATVDLAEINLFSGDMTLLKYGAAASYVKTGDRVRRVSGRSFAAGLAAPRENEPDMSRVNMRPGSFAVIVSDGVTGGGDDDALAALIAQFGEDGAPDELARAIVEFARILGRTDDDVTAIVIRIDERK